MDAKKLEILMTAVDLGSFSKASAPGQMGVKDLETVLGLLHSAM